MRYQVFTIPILILIFVPMAASVSGDIFPSGTHWLPEKPVENDEITFYTVILSNDTTHPDKVDLLFGDSTIIMQPLNNDPGELDWSQGVLHACTFKIEKTGDMNVSIRIMDEKGAIEVHNITFIEIEENEKDDDTILGLPRLYCGLSIVFITFIAIFITWSYFKGRGIQKDNVQRTGAIKISCSSCGSEVGPSDDKCSKCGSRLDEEEHVCGKCGNIIEPDHEKCSKCSARLKPVKKSAGKGDMDLEKLNKSKLNKKGKVTCLKCGAVYLREEGRCPECGSSIT